MILKIFTGIITGCIVGLFITSFFLQSDTPLIEIFWTKITASSIVTGVLCGAYAHFSKSKLQIFIISILLGMLTFYVKFLITGHDFDPLTMGAFAGAMLGGAFAIFTKINHSIKVMRRLERQRKAGFNRYG